VELLPENKAAATIFMIVRGQVLRAFNGEYDVDVDLNHVALWKAIEKFPGGIRDEWGTFQKILRAWHMAQQLKRDKED